MFEAVPMPRGAVAAAGRVYSSSLRSVLTLPGGGH
jgi:hypothetical protein